MFCTSGASDALAVEAGRDVNTMHVSNAVMKNDLSMCLLVFVSSILGVRPNALSAHAKRAQSLDQRSASTPV